VIKVLLADDQPLIRAGLAMLLSAEPDIEIVAEADDGLAAVNEAARLHPDVVLMDVRMPGMDGVEATRELRRGLPACRVVMLTTFDDDEYVTQALRGGASGYLLKDLAASASSTVPYAVISTTGTYGWIVRSARSSATPSMPGMRTSARTRSTARRCAIASASGPSFAQTTS